MDSRFKNYQNQTIRCLLDGLMCTALFQEKDIKFIEDGGREITAIPYVQIKDMFRGVFPNSGSIYFKESENKNHTVQTFKVVRFMEYVKWGAVANQ